jgi:hypothetical protein
MGVPLDTEDMHGYATLGKVLLIGVPVVVVVLVGVVGLLIWAAS